MLYGDFVQKLKREVWWKSSTVPPLWWAYALSQETCHKEEHRTPTWT